MLKRASDTIPDDRVAPSPLSGGHQETAGGGHPAGSGTRGSTPPGSVSTTRAIPNLKIINKLKHEHYDHVEDDPTDLTGRSLTGSPTLFGLINKVEYDYSIGRVSVNPKAKLEYFRRQPFVRESLLGEVIGRRSGVLIGDC